MASSKITKKRQTTVPKEVLEALHVKQGDQLDCVVEEGRIVVRERTGKLIDLAGKFSHFGKMRKRPFGIGKLNDAAASGWAGRLGA